MKRFKRIGIALTFIFVMAFSLAACDGSPVYRGGTVPNNVVISNPSLANLAEGRQVVATSFGQADQHGFIGTLTQIGWTPGNQYIRNDMLAAADITEPVLLLTTVGFSVKAGIPSLFVASETARFNAIIDSNADIKIVMLHLGRAWRRGQLTDPIINLIAPHSEVMIVIDDGTEQGGNFDGLFTSLRNANNVPLYTFTAQTQDSFRDSLRFIVGV